MNYKLFSILSFAAGAAIGSAVTWKLLKDKYEQIAKEEIESVKEVYSNRKPSIEDCVNEIIEQTDNATAKTLNDKPDLMEYAAKIKELGYANPEVKEEDEDDVDDKPYVISLDEFDEGGYEIETLTYYADGVLTDEFDEIIEDVDDIVGQESLKRFGEYEEDTVFVRNDTFKRDYEIQRDTRTYSEVVGSDDDYPDYMEE